METSRKIDNTMATIKKTKNNAQKAKDGVTQTSVKPDVISGALQL